MGRDYFIIIDKHNINEDFMIFRYLGTEFGWQKCCGCLFALEDQVLELKTRQFFYTEDIAGKRMPMDDKDWDSHYVFQYEPEADELLFHGLGDFPLDQFDKSFFSPQPDTVFHFGE